MKSKCIQCTHEFEKIEYRDNEYRFIEVFWCPMCGALKKRCTFIGGEVSESIRTPAK